MPLIDSVGPVPDDRYVRRWQSIVDDLADQGLDALVVTNSSNIRYLTGYRGYSPWAVVAKDGIHLFVDQRYRLRAYDDVAVNGAESVIVKTSVTASIPDALAGVLRSSGPVGLEDDTPWATVRAYQAAIKPTVEPCSRVVESKRLVKDTGEIALMRAAAAIADAALASARARDFVGRTEIELKTFLEDAVKAMGSDCAFDFIVAAGENSSTPHAQAGTRLIGDGEIVLVDMGAELGGYLSDMTRMLCWGDPPALYHEIASIVQEAHDSAADLLSPGVSYPAVDAAARSVIAESGYGPQFTHPTGHNVGLEIHERPFFAAAHAGVLEVGNVVTVEPGIYLDGVLGVRLEDLYVIEAYGATRLTHSPVLFTSDHDEEARKEFS